MNNRLIGICGQAQMGKDTVADYICSKLLHYSKVSFGSEVKYIISRIFDISLSDIEKYKTLTQPPPNFQINMRQTLQLIGETCRTVNENTWINNTLKNVNECSVISDVRYRNEMDAVLAKSGILVLIGRSDCLNDNEHNSEKQLKLAIEWFLTNTTDSLVCSAEFSIPKQFSVFTYFIRNDGSLSELYSNIDKILLTTI